MRSVFLFVMALVGFHAGIAQELPKDKHLFVLPAGEHWYKQRWADSTYLYDQFQPGRIELKTDVTPTNRPLLNYNIFLQTMFIEQADNDVAPLEPKGIKAVWIDNHKLIYTREFGYMEVILEGKISVAERTIMQTNRVMSYTGGGRGALIKPDSPTDLSKFERYFWRETDYFMFEDPSHVHHASIAPLFKKYPKKKHLIKSFIKSHKTDFSKKEDVLQVATYCNTEL